MGSIYRCPNCGQFIGGKLNYDEQFVCEKCNVAFTKQDADEYLVKIPRCPSCGQSLPEDFFCNNCNEQIHPLDFGIEDKP